MAFFKVTQKQSGGGGGQISEIVRVTQTEWASTTPDTNKIYLVTTDNGKMILKQYQGNQRILRKGDVSDYVFYYEDLVFADAYISGNYYDDYYIPTGIILNSTDNINRDWQLEFSITRDEMGYEEPIIGTRSNGGTYLEIYTMGNSDQLGIYGNFGDYNRLGNINDGQDVVINCENNVWTVTVDGVQTMQRTITRSVDETNELIIGDYRAYYIFHKTMNYIGFKWLT